jgi:hypothetical protein
MAWQRTQPGDRRQKPLAGNILSYSLMSIVARLLYSGQLSCYFATNWLKAQEEEMAENEEGGEQQGAKHMRKLHRKLARAVEDVSYGLRQARAYGARAEGEEAIGVKGELERMLREELGDLFKETEERE